MQNDHKCGKRNGWGAAWGMLCGVAMLALATLAAAGEAGFQRGVNLAGPEFAGNKLPGMINKNYTFNDRATFEYFARKGFTLIRVPISWERMQPALKGPLDAAYLNALKTNIAWAKAGNARVMIDVHNYCRYRGQVIDVGPAKAADLADLWVRLSGEFKNEPGVYAYDLMNEPYNLGTADWKSISQAVVTAIRQSGDTKLIAVEGSSWASAARWENTNGEPWINDPANNMIYSAHCYFDGDASGTYKKTYDQELEKNPDLAEVGRKRVKVFADWCTAHHVRGHVGEYGVPKTDPRWLVVLDRFMACLDESGLDGTYWASGIWMGHDPVCIQPTNKFTVDAPQMAVLLKHLSGKAPLMATR